jgi:hypothetical protein
MGMRTRSPRQPLSTTERISLGALARVYPPETVDAILLSCGRKEERRRRLPARLMVYFVIALALWSGSAYRGVMHKLVEGLRGLRAWPQGWEVPTNAGITIARQRLGVEPLRALFDAVARPIATPKTHGAWYRHWRVVALDGTVMDIPDSPPPPSAGPGAVGGSAAATRRPGWSPCWSAAPTPTSTSRSARCVREKRP